MKLVEEILPWPPLKKHKEQTKNATFNCCVSGIGISNKSLPTIAFFSNYYFPTFSLLNE